MFVIFDLDTCPSGVGYHIVLFSKRFEDVAPGVETAWIFGLQF
jgi:hypothetical protein